MAVTLESFEGLTNSSNSPPSFRFGEDGFFQPGFLSPFTFASGLKLLEPVPNDNDDNGETLVGEYLTSLKPSWGLVDNGKIKTENDLPHGTAFIGANQETDGTLTFGFSKNVYSVEAFVDAVRDNGLRGAITATAYDSAGNVITASRIQSIIVAGWDENLIAVQSKKPIAKVVFTGDFLVLDALSFDDAKPNIINGTKRNDKLGSAAGKDTSDGADVIIAKDGNDRIFARDGDDTVYGGKGNDKIHAGAGNDTLVGDQGKDKLWGEAGQDTFLFKGFKGLGIDTIRDFNVAEDNIILDHAGFDLLNRGHLPNGVFNDGSKPINSDVRIIYDSGSGKLSHDVDGSGKKAAVLFAKLPDGLALTADNFFVV